MYFELNDLDDLLAILRNDVKRREEDYRVHPSDTSRAEVMRSVRFLNRVRAERDKRLFG